MQHHICCQFIPKTPYCKCPKRCADFSRQWRRRKDLGVSQKKIKIKITPRRPSTKRPLGPPLLPRHRLETRLWHYQNRRRQAAAHHHHRTSITLYRCWRRTRSTLRRTTTADRPGTTALSYGARRRDETGRGRGRGGNVGVTYVAQELSSSWSTHGGQDLSKCRGLN